MVTVAEGLEARVGTVSILAVDNQRAWRDLAVAELSSLGTIDTAEGARDAKDHMEEKHYDLVLLDLHMGDEDHGDELVKYIITNHPDTPMALMSGTISEEARKTLMAVEPALGMIRKSELSRSPEEVRDRVKFLLTQKPVYRASDEVLSILGDEVNLGDVSVLFTDIDRLLGHTALLKTDVEEAALDATDQDYIRDLLHPVKMYSDDVGVTRSRVHNFKNNLEAAVGRLDAVRGENTAVSQLYIDLSHLLLDASRLIENKGDRVSLREVWLKESTSLQTVFPDAEFSFKGTTYVENEADMERIYVDPRFGEVMRIVMTNAVQAYDPGSKQTVEVSVYDRVNSSCTPNTIQVNLTNGGKPIPSEYHGLGWFDTKSTSGRSFGTKFGLQRVFDLGWDVFGDLRFGVKDGTTVASLALPGIKDASYYDIRLPEDFGGEGGKLLVYDHSRSSFRFIVEMEDQLGCEVDFMNQINELKGRLPFLDSYMGFLYHGNPYIEEEKETLRDLISASPRLPIGEISTDGRSDMRFIRELVADMRDNPEEFVYDL